MSKDYGPIVYLGFACGGFFNLVISRDIFSLCGFVAILCGVGVFTWLNPYRPVNVKESDFNNLSEEVKSLRGELSSLKLKIGLR